MRIYCANSRDASANCLYPNMREIKDAYDLADAVACDYVPVLFKNNYRSNGNFVSSDVLIMDVDNDDSCVTPEELHAMLPDVRMMIHFSRHNNVVKGSNGPKPRFHAFFAIDKCDSADEYSELKRRLASEFSCFDGNAIDCARFFYGTGNPEVVCFEGTLTLNEYFRRNDSFMLEGGNTIPQGSRNSTMSRFASRVMKRYGNCDEAHRLFMEQAARCEPPLEEDELDAIWRSAGKFYSRICKTEGYVAPEKYNNPAPSAGWEAPIPFGDYVNVPFPVDALPDVFRDYVLAVAESTQTPVDMAASIALSVMSTCLQGKYRVEAKRDWIEPLNTYVLIIAPPSERKSAVLKAMTRPVAKYEDEYNRINAGAVESSKMRRRLLEKRQKAIEDNYIKGKASEDEIKEISEKIAGFTEIRPLQLIVDDVTTEKLTSVMSDNGGRMALISSEGGIFDTISGMYSKSVNIDVFLKAYSGDVIKVDRIGRDSLSIMNPTLTILLMVQPSVIAEVMKNKIFRGRGLTARFLYAMPETMVGHRNAESKTIDPDIAARYEARVRDLLEDDSDEVITLTAEANSEMVRFANELEKALPVKYAETMDWSGKLVGVIARIAALLCRASTTRANDFLKAREKLQVSAENMRNAIMLGRYFQAYANRIYSTLSTGSLTTQANLVLKTAAEKKLTELNRRSVMRNCRSFKLAEEVQPVLDFLEEYGYIRCRVKTSPRSRQASDVYDVHPRLNEYLKP